MNFELAHPRGQAQLLREFVPGEPRSTGAGTSAGCRSEVPGLGDAERGREVGTPTGPYLAYGIGSARRAVRFDPHYGPETLQHAGAVHRSPPSRAAASRVLIGALAYNAARRGEPTIILDPSGPLAKLCDAARAGAVTRGCWT